MSEGTGAARAAAARALAAASAVARARASSAAACSAAARDLALADRAFSRLVASSSTACSAAYLASTSPSPRVAASAVWSAATATSLGVGGGRLGRLGPRRSGRQHRPDAVSAPEHVAGGSRAQDGRVQRGGASRHVEGAGPGALRAPLLGGQRLGQRGALVGADPRRHRAGHPGQRLVVRAQGGLQLRAQRCDLGGCALRLGLRLGRRLGRRRTGREQARRGHAEQARPRRSVRDGPPASATHPRSFGPARRPP